jgi:hypothetical protein
MLNRQRTLARSSDAQPQKVLRTLWGPPKTARKEGEREERGRYEEVRTRDERV